MASQTKNMTTGKPGKLILSFALPLMLGNVFQQLYTVVDTMVVGKYLGVNALAALGAADWMNWMMLGIVQGFTQGFGILMAQKFGAGKEDQLKKVIGNSVFLSAVFAIFLVLLGQTIAVPVLKLLQTPETILGDTLLYLRIMFAGIPIVMAYNLLACILRSLGDGKTPLHAMIVASFTNIALDTPFCHGFPLGNRRRCHSNPSGAACFRLLLLLLYSEAGNFKATPCGFCSGKGSLRKAFKAWLSHCLPKLYYFHRRHDCAVRCQWLRRYLHCRFYRYE